MKKSLLIATMTLALSLFIHAQTVIPTWYVIPPTSGCNGVWAVQASAVGCGSGPYTYSMNPMGCVILTSNTVQDTTYWQLCAYPCDLTIINAQGNMCICSTGVFTQTDLMSEQLITTTYPNPATTTSGWNVQLREPGNAVTVNIYNSVGQLVSAQSSESGEQIFHIDTSTLTAGSYFAEISVNGAEPYRQQLFLTQ